jgi:alkanesulfonate monooxygenase SsuD/methylene tetrahydromethanopterin reductase-like flavin-dependent oxidoreductase (luciferase family)
MLTATLLMVLGAGGSHILAYAHTAQQQRESTLIDTPDEIVAKLQTLQAAGVEYVMLNAAGSRANLRRFTRQVMPHLPARRHRDSEQDERER